MKLSEKKNKTNKFFFDLNKILENNKKPFFLHEPFLDKTDKSSISKCVDSKFISTAGKYTEKFENEFRDVRINDPFLYEEGYFKCFAENNALPSMFLASTAKILKTTQDDSIIVHSLKTGKASPCSCLALTLLIYIVYSDLLVLTIAFDLVSLTKSECPCTFNILIMPPMQLP